MLRSQRNDGGINGAGEEAQRQNKPRHMRLRAGNKQIHQYRRHTRQYGQNALQIEKAQDKAERPHAKHIGHPEITHQRPGVIQAHAEAFGVFRHPGDKAQLAKDIAQRGDGEKQYANAPFFFDDRRLRVLRMFTQRRKFTAEGQDENRQVDQADTGVDPVPLNTTRQQEGGDHRKNHPRHAEEGVGKQQSGTALTPFIQLRNQEGANRHGDPADQPQHKHRR